MTQTEDLTNAGRRRAADGQVTGGLTRPLQPSGYDDHGISGRSDAGHDDNSAA